MKKLIYTILIILGLQLNSIAETRTNKVWSSGAIIYGQATLNHATMDRHTFTTKVRFVNTRTGVATPWVPKITNNGADNVNKIQMTQPSIPDQFRMEANYNVSCPYGVANSDVVQSTLFLIGYSLNCLYLVPGTQQLVTKPDGTKNYYGLYSLAPGCDTIHCQISNNSGFNTPFSFGKASANIQMKYWWLYVFWGSTYCLDAYEANRSPCSGANCGDFAK